MEYDKKRPVERCEVYIERAFCCNKEMIEMDLLAQGSYEYKCKRCNETILTKIKYPRIIASNNGEEFVLNNTKII